MSLVLVLATVTSAFQQNTVYGVQLDSRSLTLQSNTAGTIGGSTPGGTVNHEFKFTIPTGGNVGSIKFEYCTTAADAPAQSCATPIGLTTTGAALGTSSGVTGWSSVVTPDTHTVYVTRSAANVTASTVATIQVRNITNPSATNATFYARISTYVSTDTSGTAVDTGSVAASTATQILLSGIMPESLVFCAGKTITVNTGVPDCSVATLADVKFDRLFSPSDTAVATSQMAASTNAKYGYVITVTGPTLTSGSNTITAMTSAGASTHGTAQFGMNLKANTTATTTPATGAEVSLASDGTNLRGRALAGYNTVDTFKFVPAPATPDPVADSAQGGAGPTNGQVYTTTYIVNVPGNQLPGTYTSTITYICTPTF